MNTNAIQKKITPEEVMQVLTGIFLSRKKENHIEAKIWDKILSSEENLQIFLDCFFDMQFIEMFQKTESSSIKTENNIFFHYFQKIMKFTFEKKNGKMIITNTQSAPITLNQENHTNSEFLKSTSFLLWEQSFPNCVFYLTYFFHVDFVEICLEYKTSQKHPLFAKMYLNDSFLEEKKIVKTTKNFIGNSQQAKIENTFAIYIKEMQSSLKKSPFLLLAVKAENQDEFHLLKTKIKIGDK